MNQLKHTITHGIAAVQEIVREDGFTWTVIDGHGYYRHVSANLVEPPPEKIRLVVESRFRFVFSHPLNQREIAIRKLNQEPCEVWA